MEGFERQPQHEKAKEEAKAGKRLEDHVVNLYDESGHVDESTGQTINNSPEITGADESKQIKQKRGKNDDLMGSVRGELPKDLKGMAEWMKKEEERLLRLKQKRKKAA